MASRCWSVMKAFRGWREIPTVGSGQIEKRRTIE
jgi:hypothetical protein